MFKYEIGFRFRVAGGTIYEVVNRYCNAFGKSYDLKAPEGHILRGCWEQTIDHVATPVNDLKTFIMELVK